MQDFTALTIDYGDNPPELHQLTINNRPNSKRDNDYRNYNKEYKPIFSLHFFVLIGHSYNSKLYD